MFELWWEDGEINKNQSKRDDDATNDIRNDGEFIGDVARKFALNMSGHQGIRSISINIVKDASDDDGSAVDAKSGFKEDTVEFAILVRLLRAAITK